MERYTWVRFAGKLTACHTQIWRRSANQWGDGTLHVGSIRGKAHPLPHNTQSNGQHTSGANQGRWRKRLGRFKMQALTHCNATFMSTRTAAGQFKGQFKGAMEEMSGKVQNANTHILRRQNHEHAHSSRSVKGQFKGAMEHYMRGFDSVQKHYPRRRPATIHSKQ